jgi:hypothetical protein
MLTDRRVFILSCLVLFSIFTSGQGYDIKIKINGLTEKQLILGHYLSKSMYPDDTTLLDNKGSGIFAGTRKLPGGMYLIYLPNSRYFEIIIGEDQSFSVEVDTTDFLKTLSIKGSDENQLFLDFQRLMVTLRKQADSLSLLLKNQTDQKSNAAITDKLRKINDTRIALINKTNQEHPDLFVATFLKATLETEVPDPPKDENGNVKDSAWQYYYYRNHYFDNFNISDPRLLRTPFYEDKIMTYLTKIIPQVPDSLIPQVDFLIERARADSNLFRYMLITLFNYYGKSNIMGMDAVQVHIADKYYLRESWWSDDKFLAELKDRIENQALADWTSGPGNRIMSVPADHFRAASTDTVIRKNPHVGTPVYAVAD